MSFILNVEKLKCPRYVQEYLWGIFIHAMFVKYAFLADSATIDAAGKLTAMGIFDIIFAPKFPVRHRDMTLVAYLEGSAAEKGNHKLSVELRDDKANRLGAYEQTIALNPTSLRAGMMFKLLDFVYPRAGQYEFVIFADDRFLGRVTFSVQKIIVQEVGEK